MVNNNSVMTNDAMVTKPAQVAFNSAVAENSVDDRELSACERREEHNGQVHRELHCSRQRRGIHRGLRGRELRVVQDQE